MTLFTLPPKLTINRRPPLTLFTLAIDPLTVALAIDPLTLAIDPLTIRRNPLNQTPNTFCRHTIHLRTIGVATLLPHSSPLLYLRKLKEKPSPLPFPLLHFAAFALLHSPLSTHHFTFAHHLPLPPLLILFTFVAAPWSSLRPPSPLTSWNMLSPSLLNLRICAHHHRSPWSSLRSPLPCTHRSASSSLRSSSLRRIICFVCGVKVLAKMIDFFLSDPNQSDEAQDSDSIKWRISLLKELESVIWPGMLSGGHAEVRLWLYSSSQV
ncbi:hypothetical protein Ahy_B08g090691 [Arachis hypogaea]|uniref:Uncharacterized protein n=1 Tax=Arachis hypogaea TaxID=3818 RepID=A0A444Y0I3_ARAHY|nr:hypothetical protein Ahy_B08g090691 [Arachis hypogaea]